MTILDADTRDQIAARKREIKALEKPDREARAKIRKADRKQRAQVMKSAPKEQRQERQRDNAYLAFVRRLPCAVGHVGGCQGPTEAAHLRFTAREYGRINPGLQRKSDDRWANPLCQQHHREQHTQNEEGFWRKAGVDPNALAVERYAAFTNTPTSDGVVRDRATGETR